MNVQNVLIQLFEELGYHREKQVRMKKLSFVGPPPGTYRFDRWYNISSGYRRAYLTTHGDEFCEFVVHDSKVKIFKNLVLVDNVDLTDPNSLDIIEKIVNEHS